ncbi:MAG TPA: hypothetical protein VF021_05465 [Longimicrobiales bacterium]
MLSAEELLAGSALTYDVSVPPQILQPGAGATNPVSSLVRLRPLTVADLQLITRASKQNDDLMASLMVQRALVEPALTVPQVAALHVGLLEFLLAQVMRVSGMAVSESQLRANVEAPLAKAAHILAREFGWTPPQVSELTLGQIMVHLQMLEQEAQA